MNILVTGGAGFIGSLLCERLIKDNHTVVCVDDLSAGKVENLQEIMANPNFKFEKLDINDLTALISIIQENNIEMIYHLAANSSISEGSKDTGIDLKRTFQTTYSVLEAMRFTGLKKLFFSSTSAVYGDKGSEALI